MSKTGIPYLEEVLNVTSGCTPVSEGCQNCWASDLHRRFHGQPYDVNCPIKTHPERLKEALGWRTPRQVGVCFTSDLFHDGVPDEFIDKVFAVMALTPQHRYLLLTKRPERMREYLAEPSRVARVDLTTAAMVEGKPVRDIESFVRSVAHDPTYNPPWPLPNVWLGVSCENQARADERIPLLLTTPAAHRWVSLEPLLGKIKFAPGTLGCVGHLAETFGNPLINWIVCGGESGAHAREMTVWWMLDLWDQCYKAGVPFYCKQDSGLRPGMQGRIPADLWAVRELPEVIDAKS